MIEFDQFSAVNFGNYADTTISFSRDRGAPLTFMRGINKSGKTTLFRAMLWTIYGNDVMPKVVEGTHPVRPDYAGDGELTTHGRMCFVYEQDGRQAYYRLTRSMESYIHAGQVITKGGSDENVVLERRDNDDWEDEAGYTESPNMVQVLRNSFFRPEFVDIVFADADKAEEFVGGANGANATMMRDRVTAACRSLLSADRLRKIKSDRATRVRKELDSELAEQSDARKDLHNVNREIESTQSEIRQHEGDLRGYFEQALRLKKTIEQQQAIIQQLDEDSDEVAELVEKRNEHEKRAREAAAERKNLLVGTTDEILSPGFVQAVLGDIVAEAAGCLGGLHDDGLLPREEVAVITRVIDRGECICGRSVGHSEQEHLQDLRDRSRTTYADQDVFEEVRRRLVVVESKKTNVGKGWQQAVVKRHAEIARLDGIVKSENETARRLSDAIAGGDASSNRSKAQTAIETSQTSLGHCLAGIEDKQRRIGALYIYTGDDISGTVHRVSDDAKTGEVEDGLSEDQSFWSLHYEGQMPTLRSSEHQDAVAESAAAARVHGFDPTKGLVAELASAQAKKRRLTRKAASTSLGDLERDLARATEELLERAEKKIMDKNIPLISEELNATYRAIVGPHAEQVSLRLQGDKYEIHAVTQDGDHRSMGMLNSASRRALSTAFLLALLSRSNTRVPFVSDSLLHAVDHDVRTRLIKHVAETHGQPIMFGIRSDVRDQVHRKAIQSTAGMTYTITNRDFYPDPAVNEPPTDTDNRSLICRCGPGSYCDLCELIGDADSPHLQATTSERVN